MIINDYDDNSIEEWKKAYINYTLLMELSDQNNHFQLQNQTFDAKSHNFDNVLRQEIVKADSFFKLKMEQGTVKLEILKENLEFLKQDQLDQVKLSILFNVQNNMESSNYYQKNHRILKKTTKNFYKECKYLRKFVHQNKQAILKLLYTKRKNYENISRYYNDLELVKNLNKLNMMIEECQWLYNKYFDKESKKNEDLKNILIKDAVVNRSPFYFGFYTGFALMIIIQIIIYRISILKELNIRYVYLFPMFRGLWLFLMYYWLLILNLYGWKKSNINYKGIFEYNQHSSAIYQHLKRAGFFTMLFLVVFFISVQKELIIQTEDFFYFDKQLDKIPFDPALGPLIIWVSIIIYLCTPTKKEFFGEGKRYLWRNIYYVFCAAFIPMTFTTSWFTDQFVSFVGPFKDTAYTICFYYHYFSYGDRTPLQCRDVRQIEIDLLMASFPLILRMIQCGRAGYDQGKFLNTDNFLNFLKYLVSLCVAITSFLSKFYSSFFYYWILSAAVSCSYSYYWDVIKDWQFLQTNSKYPLLRSQLAYDTPKIYYSILISNTILRLAWTLTISPNMDSILGIWNESIILILSFLEIFRRFLWNFIRVEREHITIYGKFRVVPQLKFPYKSQKDEVSTQVELQTYFNREWHQKKSRHRSPKISIELSCMGQDRFSDSKE